MTEAQQTVITRNTRLTIGVALTIFAGIVYQLQAQNETTLAIREVQRDIMEMRHDFTTHQVDRWTGADMANWVRLLKAQNPGITIPEVTRRP